MTRTAHSVAMYWSERWVLLFLWILFPHLCHSQRSTSGPFRIIWTEISNCEDTGTKQFYYDNLEIIKVNDAKYLYSFDVTIDLLMDDFMSMEWDVAILKDGEWKPHYMQVDFPNICSMIKNGMPNLFKNLKEKMHFDDCPVPPGKYEVVEMDFDNISEVMAQFHYGKYRADAIVTVNGTRIGCPRYFFEAVPLKRTTRTRSKPKNRQ